MYAFSSSNYRCGKCCFCFNQNSEIPLVNSGALGALHEFGKTKAAAL